MSEKAISERRSSLRQSTLKRKIDYYPEKNIRSPKRRKMSDSARSLRSNNSESLIINQNIMKVDVQLNLDDSNKIEVVNSEMEQLNLGKNNVGDDENGSTINNCEHANEKSKKADTENEKQNDEKDDDFTKSHSEEKNSRDASNDDQKVCEKGYVNECEQLSETSEVADSKEKEKTGEVESITQSNLVENSSGKKVIVPSICQKENEKAGEADTGNNKQNDDSDAVESTKSNSEEKKGHVNVSEHFEVADSKENGKTGEEKSIIQSNLLENSCNKKNLVPSICQKENENGKAKELDTGNKKQNHENNEVEPTKSNSEVKISENASNEGKKIDGAKDVNIFNLRTEGICSKETEKPGKNEVETTTGSVQNGTNALEESCPQKTSDELEAVTVNAHGVVKNEEKNSVNEKPEDETTNKKKTTEKSGEKLDNDINSELTEIETKINKYKDMIKVFAEDVKSKKFYEIDESMIRLSIRLDKLPLKRGDNLFERKIQLLRTINSSTAELDKKAEIAKTFFDMENEFKKKSNVKFSLEDKATILICYEQIHQKVLEHEVMDELQERKTNLLHNIENKILTLK